MRRDRYWLITMPEITWPLVGWSDTKPVVAFDAVLVPVVVTVVVPSNVEIVDGGVRIPLVPGAGVANDRVRAQLALTV